MTDANTAAKADLLHRLHDPDHPLLLANVWDVASARLVEATGAPAIATTSAGAAWSLGSADGDQLGRDRAVQLVARIAAAVDLPVTADVEAGYGGSPAAVAETVEQILRAGAVGINLEDAHHENPSGHGAGPLFGIDAQCERIAAARHAAGGTRLFLNARTDTYLRGVGDPAGRLQDTLERAAAYVAAGADGVFIPGLADPAAIAELTRAVPVPVNILAGPGSPGVAELTRLGVARISLGSAVAQAAYGLVRRAATELFERGEYPSLADGIDYSGLDGLFPKTLVDREKVTSR